MLRHRKVPARGGEVTGRISPCEPVEREPYHGVWTIHFVKGLPKDEVLTVYANEERGVFTSAFAFSPNFSRRPFEIDVSGLKVVNGQLQGRLVATRLNKREPDGGERSQFADYAVEGGVFKGTTVDGVPVQGEVWTEVRPRRSGNYAHRVWLKLEDGFAGGAMWQNRVFFDFEMKDGKFVEGRATNNKGVFDALMTNADVEIDGDSFSGTLRSTIKKSGSVRPGNYVFRLVGHRAGDVLCGRFYTVLEGEEDHSGYFVGLLKPR